MESSLQQVVFECIGKCLENEYMPYLNLPQRSYLTTKICDAVKEWAEISSSEEIDLWIIKENDPIIVEDE